MAREPAAQLRVIHQAREAVEEETLVADPVAGDLGVDVRGQELAVGVPVVLGVDVAAGVEQGRDRAGVPGEGVEDVLAGAHGAAAGRDLADQLIDVVGAPDVLAVDVREVE